MPFFGRIAQLQMICYLEANAGSRIRVMPDYPGWTYKRDEMEGIYLSSINKDRWMKRLLPTEELRIFRMS